MASISGVADSAAVEYPSWSSFAAAHTCIEVRVDQTLRRLSFHWLLSLRMPCSMGAGPVCIDRSASLGEACCDLTERSRECSSFFHQLGGAL